MIERRGYLGDLGPGVEDGLLAEAGPPWLRLAVLVTPRVHVHLHGEAGGGPRINLLAAHAPPLISFTVGCELPNSSNVSGSQDDTCKMQRHYK